MLLGRGWQVQVRPYRHATRRFGVLGGSRCYGRFGLSAEGYAPEGYPTSATADSWKPYFKEWRMLKPNREVIDDDGISGERLTARKDERNHGLNGEARK